MALHTRQLHRVSFACSNPFNHFSCLRIKTSFLQKLSGFLTLAQLLSEVTLCFVGTCHPSFPFTVLPWLFLLLENSPDTSRLNFLTFVKRLLKCTFSINYLSIFFSAVLDFVPYIIPVTFWAARSFSTFFCLEYSGQRSKYSQCCMLQYSNLSEQHNCSHLIESSHLLPSGVSGWFSLLGPALHLLFNLTILSWRPSTLQKDNPLDPGVKWWNLLLKSNLHFCLHSLEKAIKSGGTHH